MKPKPLSTSDQIFAHSMALGTALGISERELAKSALAIAIGIADEKGDPDRYLAMLMELVMKKGRKNDC